MPLNRSSSQPPASHKRSLLRQISLFADLADDQLDGVAKRSRLVEYPKGEIIYSQGDPPDAFYGLISGRVQVFVRHESDQIETLELLHRGDYFGMISVLTHEPHSVTAQAVNDSILLKIQRSDFEQILRQIPEVAIHMSTTLSRRLRQKDLPVHRRVFESTLVSIYSPTRGSGRTMYAINLAASLHQETGKKVIVMDVSPAGDAVCRALGVTQCPVPVHLRVTGFDPTRVAASIVKHPSCGFDTLNIAHDPDTPSDVTQIAPLLSYLANLYHFVITDLPTLMDRTVFKALVQSDLIHLVSEATREQLRAAARVSEELRGTVQQAVSRIRIVVNEARREVEPLEAGQILQQPVHATLPAVVTPTAPGRPIVLAHPDWEYARVVRRISREIGEVLVGLALGSGAAMGIAHVGVIRVLEREKIPVDVIAGSSMGALVGAFWASGLNSQEMETIANQFRTRRAVFDLADLVLPKFGIIRGGQVLRFLHRHLGNKTFRDLKIPLKVTAVDYHRRDLVVLDEGPVVPAIRASVSIPGIFEPVRIRGRWLIDGGVLAPVPQNVLARMGVHKIIAVNTLPSPDDIHQKYAELARDRARRMEEARLMGFGARLKLRLRRAWWRWVDTNIFDVIVHTLQGMEYVLAEAQCAQAEVALHPTIPTVNWWDVYNIGELIARGEAEAEAHLAEIKKLVSESG